MVEMLLKPSAELAYLVGVIQCDGCLDIYHNKRRGITYYRISVSVGKKSLPMLERFQSIANSILGSNVKMYKCKNEAFKCTIGVKRLLKPFEDLDIILSDPPIPPKWVILNSTYFGAYLAGLIDGDGCIVVKRPKYPRCVIEIVSGNKQTILAKATEEILGCSVFQRYRNPIRKNGRIGNGWYELSFYVSSKTLKFVSDFVMPHLQLVYKREKLQEFISNRQLKLSSDKFLRKPRLCINTSKNAPSLIF